MRHNFVIFPYHFNLTLLFCQYFVMEVDKMTDNKSRYTLRIDPDLLEKLGYIAEYEGRTKNKELERLVKLHIAKFEQEHGKIEL